MEKQRLGKDFIGVGGGVLILNDKGETFLLKRGKNSKNEVGFWNKPGGMVEWGDTGTSYEKRDKGRSGSCD